MRQTATFFSPPFHQVFGLLAVIIFAAAWTAPLVAAQPSSAQPCDSLLARGDSAYRMFDNDSALSAYFAAYRQCPGRYEPLMKMTRAYNDAGEDAQNNDLFTQALRYADTLQRRFPDSMQGYFLKAAAAGNLAESGGPRQMVAMARTVEHNAKEAIKRDSSYSPAYVILGAYYQRVASANAIMKQLANLLLGGIPDGTYDDALRYLEKGAALDTTNLYAFLELGKTYRSIKKPEKAKKQFRKVLELPIHDHQHRELQRRARRYLEGKEP